MSSARTETTVVEMPQMGVSVAEGTVVEWRKRPGDWVDADEAICDVTTDKIDVEIPSPAAGRLARTLVEEGETVAVGEPIAEIDTGARPGEAHPAEDQGEAPPVESSGEAEPEEIDRSGFYSPVVRRIAAEYEVDLERVEGHGVGGRVRRSDLVAFIRSREADPTAGSAGPDAKPNGRPLHTESPYRPDSAPAGGEAEEIFGPSRRQPMSAMRRQIARHMVASRQTAAHCTTVVEVDFSRVAAERERLREAMKCKDVPLTWLAFVAEATVAALAEAPALNASIDGDEIVYHDDVNLGIAVALDDGLVVPVIRRAQRLSLEGLAAAIAELADRARSGRLDPDDVSGGTFTITNPGRFGAVIATPIINQPQVGILDLEAVVRRPVALGSGADEAIAVRPMSYLCMSWDHRALDGVEAARFMGSVKRRLEGGDER